MGTLKLTEGQFKIKFGGELVGKGGKKIKQIKFYKQNCPTDYCTEKNKKWKSFFKVLRRQDCHSKILIFKVLKTCDFTIQSFLMKNKD